MKKFTKKERAEYYAKVRTGWEGAKKRALDSEEEYEAAYIEAQATVGSFSFNSFVYIAEQLKKLNLGGIPYIETKTYKGWRETGFSVRKGESSKIHGVTFMQINKEEEGKTDSNYSIPKVYALFHSSQVEPIV